MAEAPRSTLESGSVLSLPGQLLAGLSYPLRALRIINLHRSLWSYVVIPIVVNIVAGSVLYAGLLYAGLGWIDSQLAGLPDWAMFLRVLLQIVLVLVLLVVLGFVLLQFGVLLGAPWYSQLSEKLEEIYTGRKPETPPASALVIMRDIRDALLFEMKKLLLLVAVGLPALLLNFVLPPVGPLLSTIIAIGLAATIACLDFLDSSLSRRRLRFRTKLSIIRRTLPASGTFALICLALISVPLINLLAIPLCVGAGTLFFCDRIWDNLLAGAYGERPAWPPARPPEASNE